MTDAKHECPYGGDRTYECICGATLGKPCGRYGHLCDRCKDRSAREQAALISKALRLVAAAINPAAPMEDANDA